MILNNDLFILITDNYSMINEIDIESEDKINIIVLLMD